MLLKHGAKKSKLNLQSNVQNQSSNLKASRGSFNEILKICLDQIGAQMTAIFTGKP